DVRPMSTLAGVAGTMVTSCLPVIPLAYIAITEPAPTLVDAVNAPLELTVPMPPVTLHVSGTFGIALPNRSVVSATNVRAAPAGMSTGPSKLLPPTSMTTWIRSRCPGVTSTPTTRVTPPEEIVMLPDPAREPAARTAVGDPVSTGATLPIVVAQTNLSPEISFPYRSNPCAWRARFEPASRLTAAGCKATVARTSGTISTIAVPVAD